MTWEEANLGTPAKLWTGNSFGSMHFEVLGHKLQILEPKPGRFYCDEKASEQDAERVVPQGQEFNIVGVRIASHEEREGVMYFIIEVTTIDGNSWKVYKRYNMFFDLREKCDRHGHTTSHSFPSKTLLKVTGEALDERRKSLDWYMTEMTEKARQPWGGVLRPVLTEFLSLAPED